MAFSTPLTAVSNSPLTASQWNASVRDNILETSPAKATAAGQMFVSTAANAIAVRVPTTASVSTSEGGVVSTSYGSIPGGTVGPAASSVTTGTQALVIVGARLQNTTATAENYAGFTITGATPTVAATDNSAMFYQSFANNAAHRGSAALIVTGLTAGSNTFTMQYRVSAGSGTFATRQLAVLPF